MRCLTAALVNMLVVTAVILSLSKALADNINISKDEISFTVEVFDVNNTPVKDAVIILTPTFAIPAQEKSAQLAEMNQVNKQFEPHVLVVESGTDIIFPNADNLFHHVYSFSPTKSFELKLYKEFTSEPLRFDQPGIVDIGCNIHDWMLGFIFVTDSPFYTKTTAEGNSTISSLPKGTYNVSFWHPLAPQATPFESDSLTLDATTSVTLKLEQAIISDDGFDDGFGDY